ncbi:MAG: TonB-dependent siderophore myxochelin receptor MxcH, partial [Myxococcales bacterium]|nr:TonB-dependent siderophore myxochelin receptor MxcH [Myxococcales bacterium]
EVEAPATDAHGRAFDQAALDAAKGLRFEPARLEGEPVAVRVRYVYVFEPPAAPAASISPTPTDTALPAPAVPPSPPPERPMVVIGLSPAEALRRSAEAVTVIETEPERRASSDLGEVLARTEGVALQRAGGLGSGTRFSLNGLTGDQIRFLVDGVPLELTGFGPGIAHVPLDRVARVEIYRGVVPIRFGADALGGVVNLVTDDDIDGTGASAAYQLGSFGTHRVSLAAHHRFGQRGPFVRADGFFDRADNDYPIDVEVVDERGRPRPATVRRFHDDYRAFGGGLEVGVAERSWADRLSLRAFATAYEKALQHNAVMTRPYGEPVFGRASYGAALRYRLAVDVWAVDGVAGVGHRRSDFEDLGAFVYDWRGERVVPRRTPGELDGQPHDRTTWDDGGYARLNGAWTLAEGHTLRAIVAPTGTLRSGTERRKVKPTDRDPLDLDRRVVSLVEGVAYAAEVLGGRLENVAFVKGYHHWADSEDSAPGGSIRTRSTDLHAVGFGDALRLRVGDGVTVKASYERATRMPRADELFGDTVLVVANLDLQPERSDNVNLGVGVDSGGTRAGRFRAEVDGFARLTDDLIVLWGSDQTLVYENVYGARSVGVQGHVDWEAPGGWAAVTGNVTWQDFRNVSDQGIFGDFEGDRVPNRPWLFAHVGARLRARGLLVSGDALSVAWHTRYVHGFFRGWESIGAAGSKQTVPSQQVHGASLTARLTRDRYDVSTGVEVTNLTDEKTYDFFGVQRPGRALYWKTTMEL